MSSIARTILFPVALVVLLGGCGLSGKWQLREVHPDEAKQHFNLDEIQFNDDDSFVAISKQPGGGNIETRGRYEYSDWSKTLRLRIGAKELEYKALTLWFNKLQLERKLDNGLEFRAVFEPVPDRPESGTVCPTCGEIIP